MAHQIDGMAIDGERRTRRVWIEDGLIELMAAAAALTTAAALIATQIHFLFWFAFVLLATYGLPHVVRFYFHLKARLADPRVGYVRPRPWPHVRWLASLSRRTAMLVFVGATAAWVALVNLIPGSLDVNAEPFFDWLGVAAWMALPVVIARRTGLRRFYLYVLVRLALEVATRLAGLDESQRYLTNLVVLGALAAVFGGLALRAYLRAHPLPVAG